MKLHRPKCLHQKTILHLTDLLESNKYVFCCHSVHDKWRWRLRIALGNIIETPLSLFDSSSYKVWNSFNENKFVARKKKHFGNQAFACRALHFTSNSQRVQSQSVKKIFLWGDSRRVNHEFSNEMMAKTMDCASALTSPLRLLYVTKTLALESVTIAFHSWIFNPH